MTDLDSPILLRRRLNTAAAIAALAGGLAACQVGPDFHAPVAPTATGYTAAPLPPATAAVDAPGGGAQRFTPGGEIAGRWWTLYNSPALDALMDRALKANPDLEAAKAALRSAQEIYRAQHGALLPTVDAGYNVTRQQLSREISPTLANNADLFTLHTAQVNVGYTPDVFGGLHREAENALAQAQAQQFQAEAAYLTLTANVVAAAVQQASLAAQVEEAKTVVASELKILELLRHELALGEIAEPDVTAQETAIAQARQALPALQKQLAQQNDLLADLTGRSPGDGPIEAVDLAGLTLPADLPVSLPSQLVRQRPDILMAEANLHAASAAVGVAIAARLPTFPLTASAGGQATDIASLFSNGNPFWTLTGAVTTPVFQGGQLKHRQKSAEALLDQAKAQYRGTVLGAMQNVADALEALQSDAAALQTAAEVDASAAKTLASASKQLDRGEVAALALLSAEQTRLQAASALTQAQAARLADTAALFQALGGGWWNRDDGVALARTETR